MRIASSLKPLGIRKDSCVFLPRIALAFGKYSSFSLFSDSAWKGVFLVKTALKVTADLRTGVGIQADIRTVLADCMYTICTASALNTQRTADIRNRKRTC